MRGDNGKEGEGSSRNNYKGHTDKTKGGWNQGREVGMAGVGGQWAAKWRQLYLNNNFFFKECLINNFYLAVLEAVSLRSGCSTVG